MSNKLKQLRAKEGFTIIEVIIVLVIGAVIMLAVFLVVPQLQRTQRNARNQDNARRALTAVQQYLANNPSGTISSGDVTGITGDLKVGGGTTNANVVANSPAPAAAAAGPTLTTGNIWVYTNAKCSGTSQIVSSTGSVAVLVGLETGSTTVTGYCTEVQ